MPVRTAGPVAVPREVLTATIDGFLVRFADPDTVHRWHGWSDAAKAAASLRHLGDPGPDGRRSLAAWDRFQATHGDL